METSGEQKKEKKSDGTKQEAQYTRVLQSETWQVGIMSCVDDVGLCLQTALCPCIAAGLLLEFTNITSFCSGCLVSLLPVISCCYCCLARTKIRELHHIRGSWLCDLAASFIFPFCVLFQAGYEIDTKPSQILNRF
ncbi:hypothetical protein ACHWQZ_G010326 [Mnemiopsis leidyi]